MATEDSVLSALFMDRSPPLGNSIDIFTRRSLHVKVGNSESEAIPVFITSGLSNSEAISAYNEVSSVPSGSETLIATFTVPPLVSFFLQRVQVSGTNIATYRVKINGTTQDRRFTWFNGPMSETFDFDAGSERGLKLLTGDSVTVTVIHSRPEAGDFNARIQGTEQSL